MTIYCTLYVWKNSQHPGPSANFRRCLNYKGRPQDDDAEGLFAQKQHVKICHPEADIYILNDLQSRPKDIVWAIYSGFVTSRLSLLRHSAEKCKSLSGDIRPAVLIGLGPIAGDPLGTKFRIFYHPTDGI